MKTITYLLLLSTLSFIPRLNSQDLLLDGNIWVYHTLDWIEETLSPTYYTTEGDTIFNNTVYKKVYKSLDHDPLNWELENYYVRKDQDGLVYRLNANMEEILLIDPQMELDESIEATSHCIFTLDYIIPIQVLDQMNKRWQYSYVKLDPVDGSTIYSSTNGFQWLEKVGNLKHPFFGPLDYCDLVQNDTIDHALGCFFSEDQLVYGNEALCSDVISASMVNAQTDINIFPNPLVDHLFIESSTTRKIQEIWISDLQGKLYYQNSSVDNGRIRVDTHPFPASKYVVTLLFDDQSTAVRKIVKI